MYYSYYDIYVILHDILQGSFFVDTEVAHIIQNRCGAGRGLESKAARPRGLPQRASECGPFRPWTTWKGSERSAASVEL